MISLKTFREKHFIGFDTIFAFLITAILLYGYSLLSPLTSLITAITGNDNFPAFITTISQIYGTLLGFIITIAALIFTFDHSEKIEFFKKSPHYKKVLDIYINASKYLIVSLTLSMMALFVNYENEQWQYLGFIALLWSLIVCILKVWRCLWVMRKLFSLSLN